MSGRSGRFAPLALRLGLVLGAAACAWIGYEAGTGQPARAADAPPAVTVDAAVGSVTGLLQTSLSPVGILPALAADTPDAPPRPGAVDDGGETADATPAPAGASPPRPACRRRR
ncbi:hypothetical protein [Micromonospora sp. NPDC050200]|uniref:hypothetical protein n=1 Tax=Micromonospora sp. NPDC050200 TaxID=3155664 RepID=UPI0033D51417